ncbi:uncharacterized protein LOC5508455 [Nematostella vectensis]|uniref:uncharacterized protein LOC5508455 n=1 Tax=Nematostella vectensis TaxID=45351 RepID=UPI0020770345|nr:uncharacterized protein LOC5508455 [Nematostella vectensis]
MKLDKATKLRLSVLLYFLIVEIYPVVVSQCSGNSYVVPDQLRCTNLNVAATANGGSCVEATTPSPDCNLTIDGRAESGNNVYEWWATGGLGHFIKIQFAREFTIDTLRIMQRASAVEQNQKLLLEFSDGSSTKVSLSKNNGVDYNAAAGWDVRHIPRVSASWVKITVTAVYSTFNNGFKEIEFYNSMCNKNKMCDKLLLPAGKEHRATPLYGKTLSFHVKAASFRLKLSSNVLSSAERYTLDIGSTTSIKRFDGSTDVEKLNIATSGITSAEKRMVFWVDFRSANLVLGSGATVIAQWTDPDPLEVGYYIFQALGDSMDVVVCNREDKCYTNADHFWPLDTFLGGMAKDFYGAKHGETNITSFETYIYFHNSGVKFAHVTSLNSLQNVVSLGDFASDCISDVDRCEGLTVAFWFSVPSYSASDPVSILASRNSTDRGFEIKYDTSTEMLIFDVYSASSRHHIEVKHAKTTVQHYAMIWRGKDKPMQVTNYVGDYYEAVMTDVSSADDGYTYLRLGRKDKEQGQFYMSQLAIWKKALTTDQVTQAVVCSGVTPYMNIVQFAVRACGWSGITQHECAWLGCFWFNSACNIRAAPYMLGVYGHTTFLGDKSFTATSYESIDTIPVRSKMLGGGAWYASPMDTKPCLDIDLLEIRKVYQVYVMGSGAADKVHYVTSFTLAHSTSCAAFTTVQENGADKVFTANVDSTSKVIMSLPSLIDARCVRICPISWQGKVALKVDLSVEEAPVLFKGCNKGNSDYTPAGDYDKSTLTPDRCIQICGKLGKTYAALRNGVECFCSSTFTSGDNLPPSFCNDPCSGNKISRCGGRNAYSVYSVIGSFDTAFSCNVPATSASLTFVNVSCTSSAATLFNFGKTHPFQSRSSQLTYSYHSSSWTVDFRAESFVGDKGAKEMVVYESKTKVQDPPVGEHGCPAVVEAEKEFCCVLSMSQGSGMKLQGQLTGGSAVDTDICDVYGLSSGEIFPSPPGGSAEPIPGSVEVVPELLVAEEGTFVGFEVVVERGGCVAVMVLRPICGRGVSFTHCYQNGTCVPQIASCSRAAACSSSDTFATDVGLCVFNHTISENTVVTALHDSHEVVNINYVCFSGPGRQIVNFHESNFTDVKAGDIHGFMFPSNGSTKVSSRVSNATSSSPKVEILRYSGAAFTKGDILLKSGGLAELKQYSFIRYYRVKCEFLLCHQYPIGVYNEEMTIKTSHSSDLILKPTIIATTPIDGINCTFSEFTTPNTTFTISIDPHLGYNVTYDVRFGNDDNQTVFVTTADTPTLLSTVYTEKGYFTIDLSASNQLSFVQKQCPIRAMDAIETIDFYRPIPPTSCTNVTKACFVVKRGDDVNVTVDYGDGETFVNGSFDIGGLFIGCVNHTYANIGLYDLNITVMNQVSNASVTQMIIVECPVEDLAFTVVHPNRDIEVNETICLDITMTRGTTPTFTIDWGNGAIDETMDPKPCQSYNPYQLYNISISAFNNVSRENVTQEIQVHKPVFPLENFDIECPPANTTHPTHCNLTIDGGNDFTCTWDFGDGSTLETSSLDLGNETLHTYATIGHYMVCINCTNRLYNTTNCTEAIVENPIQGFLNPNPVGHALSHALVHTMTVTGGTDTNYTLTLVNIHTHEITDLTAILAYPDDRLRATATITFTAIGQYTLNGTAWNRVTPVQEQIVQLNVDKIITGALFELSSGPYFKHLDLTTFQLTMTQGSNVSVYIDYANGQSRNDFFLGDFQPFIFNYQYPAAGDYYATLFANNSVSNVTLQVNARVQNPHLQIAVTTNSPQLLPPGQVTVNVVVAEGTLLPTNSSCTIDNGNNEVVTKPFDVRTLSHVVEYSVNNSYTVNVTCKNDVDAITLVTDVEVQKEIKGCTMNVLNSGGDQGKDSPGVGASKNIFPVEHPVLFNVSCLNGTNITYTASFGEPRARRSINTVSSTRGFFSHNYSSPGTVRPSIMVSNAVSSVTIYASSSATMNINDIVLLESVEGVEVTNDGPKKLGESIEFTITASQKGTSGCIAVDLGDGTRHLYKAGSDVICQPECNIASLPSSNIHIITGFPIRITHVFERTNNYGTKVTGCNMVSYRPAKGLLDAVVAKKPCSYPSVSITESQANQSKSFPTEYTKAQGISITALIRLNCSATSNTNKSWSLYKCSNEGPEMNCIFYRSDFPNNVRLDISRRTLDYGIYKVEVNVTMVGNDVVPGISNKAFGFFRVIKSPLFCSFGDTAKAVGYRKSFVADASQCHDPDVGEGAYETTDFAVFCLDSDDDLVINKTSINLPALPTEPHPYYSQYNSSNGTVDNSTVLGGCFGYGNGRLNVTSRSLTLKTSAMKTGKKYKLMAMIWSLIEGDSRMAITTMEIEIVPGDPPQSSITCVGGCGTKINPSDRLPLLVNVACDNCGMISFEWLIYCRENSTQEWQLLSDVAAMTTTGTSSQNLVINSNSLRGGYEYRFRIRATAVMTQSTGYTEKQVVVNVPPYDGFCKITPESGDHTETYTLYCENWNDDDVDTLHYKVYLVNPDTHIRSPICSMTGDPSNMAARVSTEFSLLPGKESHGFNQTILVKVCDKYTSCTDVIVITKVTQKQLSMAEAAEAVDPSKLLLAAGSQSTTMFAATLSTALTAAGSLATAASDASDANSLAKAEEAQRMIMDLAVSMPISSPEDVTAQMSVLSMSTTLDEKTKTALLENTVTNAGQISNLDSEEEKEQFTMSVLSVVVDVTFKVPVVPASDDSSSSSGSVAASSDGTSVTTVVSPTLSPEELQQKQEAERNKTNALMKIIGSLQDGILDSIVPGEVAKNIKAGAAEITTKKDTADTLGTVAGESASFERLDGLFSTEITIFSKGSTLENNPHLQDPNAANMGGMATLEMEYPNGTKIDVSNTSKPIEVRIVQKNFKAKSSVHTLSPGGCNCHLVTIYKNHSTLFIEAIPNIQSQRLGIFLMRDSCDKANHIANHTTPSVDNSTSTPVDNTTVEDPFPYRLFASNEMLNRTAAGVWRVSVCHLLENAQGDSSETTTAEPTESVAANLNYTLNTFTASCFFYNTTTNSYDTTGITVGGLTTPELSQCFSTHLTSFASDFFVPPNKIDWSKISLDELAKNPTVFAFVLSIFGAYFLLVIWARRADRKDLEKVGLAPLPDNDPRDNYLYEIVVYTGHARGSGTTSDVRMVLSGGLDETSPRQLKDPDPNRRKFCKGNVDYFLMAVPASLGKLQQLRIWHNNSGTNPGWYLARIMVHDLQTDQKSWFINDRWLAVEEDDGMVERTLSVAGKKELTNFNLLFSTEARKNLTDGHLWFSVVARPAKSTFTRVQRLSCCLSIMLSTMLANCMFYQVDDESSTGTSVHVGPFSFSMKQVSIGITSSLVVLPANIIIVTIFRKVKPPNDPKKSLSKDQDPHNQSGKYLDQPSQLKEPEYVDEDEEEEEHSDEESNKDRKEKKKKEKEKKPKKKFSLDRRFIYVAYALVFLSSTVSAIFTIFYGLTFGKEKSEGWLSAMMISFWQDVLVSQPLKVFAMAMFFALVIKDPNKAEDDNEGNPELTQDEELVHDKAKNTEEEKTLRKLGFVDKPPNPEKLEAARQLRLKQKEMKSIIYEIVQYLFFLGIVLVIAYGNRDPMAYKVTTSMEDYFVHTKYTGMDPFDSSSDPKSYWSWVTTSFLPTLKPRYWYGPVVDVNETFIEGQEIRKARTILRVKRKNSKQWTTVTGNYVKDPSVLYVYTDGFTADRETAYMVGSPRLRQLRVKKDQCQMLNFMRNLFDECNVAYDWDKEDKDDYLTGWRPYGTNDTTDEKNKTPWNFRSAWELKGTPYWGMFASYWAGGYVADFGSKRDDALKIADTLSSQGWIDKYTRAIFAEFTIYNAYTNFFSVVTLLTEILPTGGYHHWPRVQTLRLYRYIGPEMVFVMACEIMYLAFLLLFLYKQVKKYRALGRKEYLKDLWNYLEILVLLFSLSAIGLYFARLALTKYTIGNMKETPDRFVSFQYVAFLDEWVTATCSLAVFFSFLKFLRLLRFNRKMALLSSTLKAAAKPLFYFFVYFSVIFFAYAQFGFVVFGISMDSYASFQGTMASLMGLTLGDFDFDELKQANRLFGPMFFFSYVLVVLFILMNVFLSIIVETFNEVNSDVSKQANDHEIMSFMMHTVKQNIGKQVGPAIKPTYVEPKTKIELQIDDIEEISENVQYALRNVCMEDIRQTNWFVPESASQKKKIIMQMMMEADENFTENDICDAIPVFDNLITKKSREDLVRMLVMYREKRRLEELENAQSEDDAVSSDEEKSGDSDGDSGEDDSSDEEKPTVPRATSRLEESIMDNIVSSTPRPRSQAEKNDDAIKDLYGIHVDLNDSFA